MMTKLEKTLSFVRKMAIGAGLAGMLLTGAPAVTYANTGPDSSVAIHRVARAYDEAVDLTDAQMLELSDLYRWRDALLASTEPGSPERAALNEAYIARRAAILTDAQIGSVGRPRRLGPRRQPRQPPDRQRDDRGHR